MDNKNGFDANNEQLANQNVTEELLASVLFNRTIKTNKLLQNDEDFKKFAIAAKKFL